MSYAKTMERARKFTIHIAENLDEEDNPVFGRIREEDV